MKRKGMTINEAAHEWVKEFSALPTDMIAALMEHDPNSWEEVTMPCVGDRVELNEFPETDENGNPYKGNAITGEVYRIKENDYYVELSDGTGVIVEANDLIILEDDVLPMWGTMWTFGDYCDDFWMEEKDGIRAMSECGFRVYHHEEWGYFFGINGAGYDFYEAHWIPAYKARGLQWHDPETEKKGA